MITDVAEWTICSCPVSEDTHAILGDNTSFDFVADIYIDDVICALLHASEKKKIFDWLDNWEELWSTCL